MEGEFSGFRLLSYDDKRVFDEAMQQINGVGITPLAVASQVVQGIQYKFICESTIVYPNAKRHLSVIYVLQTERHEIKDVHSKALVEQ